MGNATLEQKNDTKKFYGILAIGVLIMLVIGHLPPFGDVTVVGMRLLGIFAGCIFMWLFGYLALGGFIGVIALAIYVPGNSGNVIFPSVFGNFNLVMVLFCLLFCYGLQKSKVLDYIAARILSSKFVTKSPWHLAVAFWITGIVSGAIITSCLIVVLLVFNVLYSVAERAGMEKRNNYTSFVLILTATYVTLACALMPYSPTLLVPIGIMQATVPELAANAVPMAKILLVNWVLVGVALVAGAIVLKILLATGYLKPNLKLSDDMVIVDASDLKMSKEVKWGFFYIALIVVMMIITSVLPATNPVAAFVTRVGTIGVFFLVILLMCLTTVDGKRLMTLEEAMTKGVPWGLYFMLAAAMTLATSLAGGDSGLVTTISGFATAHLGSSSTFVFLLGILVFTLVLTNCINNVVAQQLVVPLLTMLMVAKGLNPILAVGMVGIVVDHGNVMPSGSPVGAYMHGDSEWLTSKQVYLYATLGSLCAVVGLLVAVPLSITLM